MDEMNVMPEEALSPGAIPETAGEIETADAEIAAEVAIPIATEETGITTVKDAKGTRAMAHISFWLGILGILACGGQFLLLLTPFLIIQQWFLSIVYASFGLGGLAAACAAVCLLRQHKRRKSGMAIAGLVLGLAPFATYFILSAVFS